MDANYANKMLTCEICDYKCSRKSDYERHLLTKKHLKKASKKASKTRFQRVPKGTPKVDQNRHKAGSGGVSKESSKMDPLQDQEK